ncbi:bifunctional 4-hydroxy-2-oxoglutarate aldolase/2-dehydro-3-deoxy-phosphogluconate aldolase [Populibacterium corticicola]|uniref:2-dehydro-3-deoxy-phosphogluconate aldolase n=1 Tax=Populibacterium corticicola TaxID=1812826 RepID=A0ABW5XE04_9MICO
MELGNNRIVPVVVIEQAERAAALGEALVAGGIPVAEVTLRTAAGLDSIAEMAKNPDLIVGAGTVITADQVDRVVEVGARFIVSPGLNPRVVERALEHGIDVVPGAVTPSEIMTALELGLTTLKFFPANVYGGPSALKALGAPFGNVSFIPTGGVSTTNIAEYLALKNVVAVGGSWMVPANLINDGEFDTIRQLCTDAVAAIQGDN